MNKTMTQKDRLLTILNGGIPDAPPHFEMVFFLHQEMFGMDLDAVMKRAGDSEAARADALEAFDREVAIRCVEEFGYAAVTAWNYDKEASPIRALKNLKSELGGRALLFGFSDSGVIWMPLGGESFEEFVIQMYERPEELHALARKKVEWTKQFTLRQIDAGVDFIIQNTDFGLNTGPFISPEQFREFCAPYMAELVAFMHEHRLPVIMHSDGNLNVILDQIHATGVDGYQSVDPQGNMDIRGVREKFPDWILMGNVNCAMLQETDEPAIRESVRNCMRHGGIGRRYIFSTSNCIYPGMPPESYRIMLDEYHACIKASLTGHTDS